MPYERPYKNYLKSKWEWTDILICVNCDREMLWDRHIDLDENWIVYCSEKCKNILCI